MTERKVLILGADGIIGRALMREIPTAIGDTRDVYTTDPRRITRLDLARRADVERALAMTTPDVVVNCIGIVKSECDASTPDRVREVNADAPHMLAELAAQRGIRVVHLSTDCVYDGTRGNRRETDPTDATDLYGITKALGELAGYAHCVTVRTSFIGRDPKRGRGLLEWLLASKDDDTITSYTKALWSGLSAPEFARAIHRHIIERPELTGLYHVTGADISKADLIATLLAAFRMTRTVRRVDEPRIDRTMNGHKFWSTTGYIYPSWRTMAHELARENT